MKCMLVSCVITLKIVFELSSFFKIKTKKYLRSCGLCSVISIDSVFIRCISWWIHMIYINYQNQNSTYVCISTKFVSHLFQYIRKNMANNNKQKFKEEESKTNAKLATHEHAHIHTAIHCSVKSCHECCSVEITFYEQFNKNKQKLSWHLAISLFICSIFIQRWLRKL